MAIENIQTWDTMTCVEKLSRMTSVRDLHRNHNGILRDQIEGLEMRVERQAEQIQRLERSRADLKKFRQAAFLDHWMSKIIIGQKKDLAKLGARLGEEIRKNQELQIKLDQVMEHVAAIAAQALHARDDVYPPQMAPGYSIDGSYPDDTITPATPIAGSIPVPDSGANAE